MFSGVSFHQKKWKKFFNSIFVNYTTWLTFLWRNCVSIVQGFPSRAFLKQRLAHPSASTKTIPVFYHQTSATNIPWTGDQGVNEKQMYDSVIKGKENASKHWNCIDVSDESQYLFSVWLAYLPAYFICKCLCYVAFQNFLRLGLLFLSENRLWQPCSAEVDKNEVSKAAMWMQLVFLQRS